MSIDLPNNNNLDSKLRPKSWDEYIGQKNVKRNLQILIDAAKKRNEPIEHILIHGPAGLGKTTLAHIISKELNTQLKITSGPSIEKVGDLASLLTNLEEGDILFIDEIHRLNRAIEEVLYPAMESCSLDIIIGKGTSARTIQLQLPRFTIIAATTRVGLLSSPLRSRFGATYRLDFYSEEEMQKIVKRSAEILQVSIDDASVRLIAKASRFTPRIANRLLKRVRDFSQINEVEVITEEITKETFKLIGIDELGLEEYDLKILHTIIKKYNGGPVGIKTIAASTLEEPETIEDVYEPYLLQMGFIERTPKGRVATKKAYEYLKINLSS